MTPLALVNVPPTTILPSACTASARTAPSFAPPGGLNVVSKLPSAFKRAIRTRFVLFTTVNSPPITILPSGCTATANTGPFTPAPGLVSESTAPFVFNTTKFARGTPLNVVNEPPSAILPSGRTAAAKIGLSGPDPVLKEESNEPSAYSRVR